MEQGFSRLFAALVLAATILFVSVPAGASARSSLLTGFNDDDVFQSANATERLAGLQHTRDVRGSVVRVFEYWRAISPTRPPTRAVARDPGWAGYDWAGFDAVVRQVSSARMRLLVDVLAAPPWAEGAGRPAVSTRAPASSWKPSPTAYRDFMEAAARRYSGSYPDPRSQGAVLPRVRYWQAWNEPNLTDYLTPQWTRRRGRLVPASPGHYRRMLNGFYTGVKAVHRTNNVVTGGTAPYGDHRPGRRRMDPAYFTRALLCVSGRRRPRPVRCSGGPVRFDSLAHHPYPGGSDRRKAFNPDDVVVPDLGKLTRPLRAALRAGKVRPRRSKQLWATEISWDSSPPDPRGVPLNRHARYVQGAFYTLWRQGTDVVTWFRLRDEARGRGFEFGLQSGIFFRGSTVAADQPKPLSFRAFRFPFTAYRRRGVAQLWGLTPGAGRVVIERRRGRAWRRYAALRARGNRLFFSKRRIRKGTVLRARQGSETSLSWRIGPNETE